MNWLRKRSSPLSGLVTGLIGWNGFVVLAALLLGWREAPWRLLAFASTTAVIQVAVLWPAFFLRLVLDGRAVLRGAAWGAATGVATFAPWILEVRAIGQHPVAWLLTALYVGAPVGAFLAYFFRDDAALAARGEAVDAGRDAHWLEPFGFGAAVFALVCLPRTADAFLYTAVVGAVTGVVAAGMSHFTPDIWKRTPARFLALCAMGAALGVVGAFLLRHQPAAIVAAPSAGTLTFIVTLLRGQALVAREAAAATASPRGE
jgi:hypothetical protein